MKKNEVVELTNLDEILADLEEQTLDNIIEETDTTCPLWRGVHELHLVSMDKATNGKGVILTFANSNGDIMPAQFNGQFGNIYVASLDNFIRSIRVALHLDATLSKRDILKELQRPHNISLAVKTSMKPWGLSMYNVIDFAETMTL